MSPALPTNDEDTLKKGGVRVLVAAGSSGGHIFPALSFLDALKQKGKNIETLLLLPQNCILDRAEYASENIKYISIISNKPGFNLRKVVFVFNLLKGFLQSLVVLLEFHPDIVVGFGSLASVPAIFFAWMFRMSTLIHEQNVIPGRANLLLSMFADRIAVSFSQSRNYFKINRKKIVYTGNPIRRQMAKVDGPEALNFFGLDQGKFTILVMGGSQGSRRINLEFLKAASVGPRFQVIHLAGNADFDLLKAKYAALNLKVKLFKFLKEMHYAYSACDLVISRAGAATISEITYFQVPAILIPYPYAYAHQSANAGVLKDAGCAVVIKDEELNGLGLSKDIEYLLNHPDKIKNMRLAYQDFLMPQAGHALASEALALNA
mgnify:FL=1